MRTLRLLTHAIALCVASLAYGQGFVTRQALPGNPRGEPFTFCIDGIIYLGSGGYENDFYSYDPANDQWTPLGTLPGVTTARGFSVSFVINGKGYVCLGRDNTVMKNDLWEYDPANHQWTQKHDFPGAARMGAFGFAANGKGYVGGGTDLAFYYGDYYAYDPVNDQWSGNLGAIPTGPVLFASAFTWNGYGYLLGGGHTDGTDGVDLYRFDASTQQWQPRANFIGPAREASVAFAMGDKVYYGLGQTQFNTAFNDIYAYDPLNDEWAASGSFPGTARGWAGSCSTGSRAFVGLGWDLGTVLFNDWWEFTPAVGIDEMRVTGADVELFPVPASDAITIRSASHSQSNVTVFDAAGHVVRTAFTTGVVQLDLTGLGAGSYDVMIVGERSAPVHRRFIKW